MQGLPVQPMVPAVPVSSMAQGLPVRPMVPAVPVGPRVCVRNDGARIVGTASGHSRVGVLRTAWIAGSKTAQAEGQTLTIEEALRKRSFGKIYLEIGINEMGTGTVDSFMEAYEAAVDHLRELQPDAILDHPPIRLKAFVYLRILHDAVAGKILQPDDIIFAQEMHLVPGVVRVHLRQSAISCTFLQPS